MTLTIRSKVLLLSLTLLSIPYVGYEYVREMEQYLRDNLETSVENSALALASVLNERPLLFNRKLIDTVREERKLLAYTFKKPINLDGYLNDWGNYFEKAGNYADKHILKNIGNYSPDSLSFKHLLGKYRNHLYALFIVRDERIVYRDASLLRLDSCDHLQIVIQAPNQQFNRYIVPPQAAGWVSVYKVNRGAYVHQAKIENQIQGTWRETSYGYILELRFPLSKVGDRLGFAIADVDDIQQREIKTLIGTSPIQNLETVGKVFIPSPEIERIIRSLGDMPGRRLWVLDKQQRVLAKSGDLKREFPQTKLNMLYSLLLYPASEEFKDDYAQASRMDGEEIKTALSGQAETRWRSTADEQTVIVSAAHPVWANGQIIGAVVVEETSNKIQMVQRQAVANLLGKTLIVFSIVTVLLLAFATRLSVRLRSLRNQAETAIDVNGRVTTSQIGTQDRDEIGDLSRCFSAILERLKQYNTYLEGMASKLSHELRTPIAVVRSSLENLEQEFEETYPSKKLPVYIERAKQGIDRLNTIITRLSEATRLEQALQNADRELFNLTELVGSCIEGYRLAYPNQRFQAELVQSSITVEGAPDLIAQMLDKLISNAVDFSAPNSPIKIKLFQNGKTAHLSVINHGTALPTEMQERLFESMVSLRSQTGVGKKEPHLGLGLYIVRLIVEYHGGQVKAENNPEALGAVFTVSLPNSQDIEN